MGVFRGAQGRKSQKNPGPKVKERRAVRKIKFVSDRGGGGGA